MKKLSKVELCDRIVKWMRDYRRDQNSESMPFYLAARKYGKLCFNTFGEALQDVMEADGRFRTMTLKSGGVMFLLKDEVDLKINETIEQDESLRRLAVIQGLLKERKVPLSWESMAEEWRSLYNEAYPFPKID